MFTVYVLSCAGGFVYVANEEGSALWTALVRPLFRTNAPVKCELTKSFESSESAVAYMFTQTCQWMITTGSCNYVRCDGFQFAEYTTPEMGAYLRMLYTSMLGTYLPKTAFPTFDAFALKINFATRTRPRVVSYRDDRETESYRDDSRMKCTFCHKTNHSESRCFIKYPHLLRRNEQRSDPRHESRYSEGGLDSLPLTSRDAGRCSSCSSFGHTAASCPSRSGPEELEPDA